jgi:hypothetical protein
LDSGAEERRPGDGSIGIAVDHNPSLALGMEPAEAELILN